MQQGPARRSCAGGSPYQLFANEVLRTAKRLAPDSDRTPAGALTAEALQRARRKAQSDWQRMGLADKEAYQAMYRARLAERRQTSAVVAISGGAAAASVAGGAMRKSHWSCGAERSVIAPEVIQQAFANGAKLPTNAELFNHSEFAIRDPEPGPVYGHGLVLESCGTLGRNLCRLHPRHAEASVAHDSLKMLADRLGPSAANSCDALVMFESIAPGSDDGPPRRRHWALLCHASYQPKFSDWVWCSPAEGVAVHKSDLPLPLEVCLASAPVRIAGVGEQHELGFQHVSSDDLCLALVEEAPRWRMRICVYELLAPLRMKITGLDPNPDLDFEFGPARRTAQRQKASSATASALADVALLNNLGDPMDFSNRSSGSVVRKQQRERRAGHSSAPRVARAEQPVIQEAQPQPQPAIEDIFGGLSGDEGDSAQSVIVGLPGLAVDAELAELSAGLLIPAVEEAHPDLDADLPGEDDQLGEPFATSASATASASRPQADAIDPDQVGRALDSMADVLDAASMLAAVAPAELGHADAGSASASSTSAAPVAANVPLVGLAPPTPAQPLAPPALGPPIEGGPPGWTMSPAGYIFDEAGRHRGRITSWGKPVATNVSVKCALHGCSKAKARSRVSDGQLAQWLAQGVMDCPIDGSTSREELVKRHVRMFTF